MKIIRHPHKKSLKGSVAALGTFDGVHCGHQKVLLSAVRFARKIKAASLAITFDPHPQQLVAPERGLRLLTTLKEREDLFCRMGVEGVVVVVFNERLRRLSYENFVKKYLVGRLGVRRVFVGFDYAFGHGRAGDASHLKKLGAKYGFDVSVVAPFSINHRAVKSSAIRALVSQGDFSRALRLLGHPYPLTGRVVRGAGRGRQLGFPTANIQVGARKLLPAGGVYAATTDGRRCVVNIGSRPTFGAGRTVVEAHLPDFCGNLRGKTLEVELVKRLRDERQFADVEELKKQIRKDIARAKRVLASSAGA
jgi:riboflavin kinase / FMN adenylyltransferase